MTHIFISYSRVDTDIMYRVKNFLLFHKFNVWTDENLQPRTPSWADAIQEAIENAYCLVVLLSPDAKKSRWVKEEMRYADMQNIRIFPLLVRGNEQNSVPFGFITSQYVEIKTDFDKNMQIVTDSITSYIGKEVLSISRSTTPDSSNGKTKENQTESDTQNKTAENKPKTRFQRLEAIASDRNKKWWQRVDAIQHLSNLNTKDTLSILEAYLLEDDLDVRQAAATAIEKSLAICLNYLQLIVCRK